MKNLILACLGAILVAGCCSQASPEPQTSPTVAGPTAPPSAAPVNDNAGQSMAVLPKGTEIGGNTLQGMALLIVTHRPLGKVTIAARDRARIAGNDDPMINKSGWACPVTLLALSSEKKDGMVRTLLDLSRYEACIKSEMHHLCIYGQYADGSWFLFYPGAGWEDKSIGEYNLGYVQQRADGTWDPEIKKKDGPTQYPFS